MTAQKKRMLSGETYMATDPDLAAAHLRAQTLLARFNVLQGDYTEGQRRVLGELFDHLGEDTIVKPTLRCDYGMNISIGARTFANFDCVFLDCNRITIGNELQIAPGVHIYTATHPSTPRHGRPDGSPLIPSSSRTAFGSAADRSSVLA